MIEPDDCDFPPTVHPGREFLTAAIFFGAAVICIGLAFWKLFAIG